MRVYYSLCFSFVLVLLLTTTLSADTFAAVKIERAPQAFVGPKAHYLALGDSLAFGYQPNGNILHGYVRDYFQVLKGKGVKDLHNLGCPGETSSTFIKGGCKFSLGRVQLKAALDYLHANPGSVSPVTLDIGANDILHDSDLKTCTIDEAQYRQHLTTLDTNLRQSILPQIQAALTVNGRITGDVLVMNYYDPLQNLCPNLASYAKELNQHLAQDVQGFGTVIDVYQAFGGDKTPNSNLCGYTWMCERKPDIHPTTQGYQVIADTFASATYH